MGEEWSSLLRLANKSLRASIYRHTNQSIVGLSQILSRFLQLGGETSGGGKTSVPVALQTA